MQKSAATAVTHKHGRGHICVVTVRSGQNTEHDRAKSATLSKTNRALHPLPLYKGCDAPGQGWPYRCSDLHFPLYSFHSPSQASRMHMQRGQNYSPALENPGHSNPPSAFWDLMKILDASHIQER